MKKIMYILIFSVFCLNSDAGLFQKPFTFILKKLVKNGLTESTETAIKISCRETTETAVKLATKYGDDVGKFFVKYGDDAVKLTVKYGDDVVRLFPKYGDDIMRISRKYGNIGARVFVKHSKEISPFIKKYGDDVIKPYIEHPGLGGKLVEEFGDDAIKISGKMDDDAVIMLLKKVKNKDKRTLVNKILFHKDGKLNKITMGTLLGSVGVVSAYTMHKADNLYKQVLDINKPKVWIGLSVFLIMLSIYIVVKIKFN